jgi:acetyl-CoA carboxylase biotin carboxylase subunit
MKRALEMFVIEGIKTSIPLHRRILADADFAAGKFDTHFIDRLFAANGMHAGGGKSSGNSSKSKK